MLERLEEAIEGLDIPVDGEAIAEALALRDRLDAAIGQALASFDAAGLWDLDAARSLTDWVRVKGRCSRPEAARVARSARRCARLPVTAHAWREGTLSSGQVQAITGALDDVTVDVFGQDEPDLVPRLVPLTVRQTTVVMHEWAARVRHEQGRDDPAPAESERELFLSATFESRYALKGTLDAVGGHIVETALRLAGADERDAERTPARRRADALVEIARFFLDRHEHPAGSRHRPHVNLIVDLEKLGDRGGVRFLDGTPIDEVSAGAFLCDSVVSRALVAGSTILDYGRTTRHVSAPLFNALLLRDDGCRFDDCDVPGQRCEAHHVVSWEHGGETSMSNLVLQCHRHHRTLHKPGWSAKLLPDGTFEVTDPGGRTRSTRPPGPGPFF